MSQIFTANIPKNPSTSFIVRNIAPNGKTVKVFGLPIRNGFTYDLLSIPEISESDIRKSLLKGELLVKFKHQELTVIFSDIDLLQFNDDQKLFLQSIGITKGLEIGMDQLASDVTFSGLPVIFHQNIELIGTKNSINRTFTTPTKFINGNFLGNDFAVIVKHNGRTLELNSDYIIVESIPSTGYDTIIFTSLVPNERSSLFVDYVEEL
jgi:hypothetical protein